MGTPLSRRRGLRVYAAKWTAQPQYYLLVFPFVAVLAARRVVDGLKGRTFIAALVIFFAAFMPLVNLFRNAVVYTNASQLAKIQYVLELTDEDDYVYDGNIFFNLFRRDVDFIWYMAGEPYKAAQTLKTLIDYDYNVLCAIERYEPKVISSFGIDDMVDPRIADHYTPSPEYDDLYIRITEQTSERAALQVRVAQAAVKKTVPVDSCADAARVGN